MPYASQGMIDTLIERLHHALERTREAKSDNELGINAADHDDLEECERYNEYVLRGLRAIEIALEDTLASLNRLAEDTDAIPMEDVGSENTDEASASSSSR